MPGTASVRLMIGDTARDKALLQDEEIAFYISQDPSVWRAAARCCRSIAGGFSRDADTVQGELKTVLSVRARAYNSLAAQYTNVTPVEHVYPLVRSQKQLDRVLSEIEEAPGIVLYTLLEEDLAQRIGTINYEVLCGISGRVPRRYHHDGESL